MISVYMNIRPDKLIEVGFESKKGIYIAMITNNHNEAWKMAQLIFQILIDSTISS